VLLKITSACADDIGGGRSDGTEPIDARYAWNDDVEAVT